MILQSISSVAVLLLFGNGMRGQEKQTVSRGDIALRATLLSQEYCRGDSDVALVKLGFQLTFINQGSRTVLLNRKSGQIVTQFVVASSKANLDLQRFEIRFSITGMSESGQSGLGTTVSLPPKGFFQSSTELRVPFRLSEFLPQHLGIEPGEHVIVATVSTWPPSEASLIPLQETLGPSEFVFTSNLDTNAVLFRVPKVPSFGYCR